MARSLNKAQVIGRLGKEPEARTFANGGSVVTFTVATSDQWKDRATGERRERTEWHRVAIFNEHLGRIAQQYLRKGDQVYLEGKMETRKWQDQSGQDRYVTEIVLRPYNGEMTLLGGGRRDDADRAQPASRGPVSSGSGHPGADLYSQGRGYAPHGGYGPDDDIPF